MPCKFPELAHRREKTYPIRVSVNYCGVVCDSLGVRPATPLLTPPAHPCYAPPNKGPTHPSRHERAVRRTHTHLCHFQHFWRRSYPRAHSSPPQIGSQPQPAQLRNVPKSPSLAHISPARPPAPLSSFPRTREPKGRCPPRTCPIPVAFLRHPARVGVPPGPPAVPSAVPPQLRDGTEWGNLEHFFANSPVRAPFVIPVKHVPVKTGSGNPGAEGDSYGSPLSYGAHRNASKCIVNRRSRATPQPLCHPAPLRV